MKYIYHGIAIATLLALFVLLFIGLNYLYYGVWAIIAIITLVTLVSGWDAHGMFERDKGFFEYISNLKVGEITEEQTKIALRRMFKYLVLLVLLFRIVIWQALGLLTFNWAIFLGMFVFSFGIVTPISKLLTKKGITEEEKLDNYLNKRHWLVRPLNVMFTIFRVSMIVFAIINEFHLRIDVDQWIINLFS